ncbi:hypothetical protein K502DRAFT_223017 [Neoconidiobolus thromboides FSU 785]|nr:hypothetical protein K502DRAFT_223017 [Neoconidiobolus thromboides FSU 785]
MDEKMLNKGKNNQIDSILQDNGIQTFNTSIQQIGFDSSVNESVNSFQGIKNQLNLLLELNDNIKFSTFELNQSIHEFVINQFDIDKFNDAINAEIEKGNSLPLWLKDYLKLPFFKSLLVELFRKFPNSAVLMHCYKVKTLISLQIYIINT